MGLYGYGATHYFQLQRIENIYYISNGHLTSPVLLFCDLGATHSEINCTILTINGPQVFSHSTHMTL